MIVRYISEACLDICLCIGLQVHYYFNEIEQADVFDFDDFFFSVNTIITLLLGIIIVFFLPVVGVFYLKRFSRWETEDFDNKYGSLFEGIRKD